MNNYYDRRYHEQVHVKHFATDDYFVARAGAAKRLNFQGITLVGTTRVLEYGCGFGHNIAAIPEAWGYDVSELAREQARIHGVNVFSTIEEIPTASFDVVLSRHCLEHLEDPLGNLKLLLTFLKPGGRLVLILPRESNRQASAEPDVNQHLYCWNAQTITNLLARAGYSVVHARFQSVLGYRALLPIWRRLGPSAYYFATLAVGTIFRSTELVMHACRAEGGGGATAGPKATRGPER